MATKTLLSLATVSLLAFAAKADDPTPSYTVETTNSWFSFAAATDSLTTNWSGATRTSENNLIKVDTEAGSPALYTPAQSKPSATRYRVTGKMTVTLNAGVPAVYTVEPLPKAALVAASVNEGDKWYGWNGASWVDLSSGIETPPEEGHQYNVAIEFFVESSVLKIKYIVGNESYTVQHSSLTTLPLSAQTKVGLAGYGSFGDFGALGFESFTVEATISSAVKKAMGIEGEIDSAALNKVGANGLTKWESIVLGLPNAETVPYTAPVQTGDANTLGFTIGAAEIGKYDASGANVSVEVFQSSTVDGEFTSVANQTQGDSSNQYKATIAPDSSGVKYYKIKIKFQ